MGLVGESGSGKSMTARAIARLLPDGAQVTGQVTFDGTDVLGLSGQPPSARTAPRWRWSSRTLVPTSTRSAVSATS